MRLGEAPAAGELDAAEQMSVDELRALQLERLRWTLRHAYANVPFYRKKFDAAGVSPEDCRSLSDLAAFPVYGGVVLNHPVGGLNPHAVVASIRQGGRIVWLPTVSARHFVRNARLARTLGQIVPPGISGLRVATGSRLNQEVDHILDLIAEHDLILASGHV